MKAIETIKKSTVKANIAVGALTAVPLSERKKKSFAETVVNANKTYTISTAYDLNGATVMLPANVTLQFTGGGHISNGTIVGRNTIIRADRRVFFDLNVRGTFDCPGNVAWFADGSEVEDTQWGIFVRQRNDDTKNIQLALDSDFRELHFPPKPFYITDTLILRMEKRLILHGSPMKLPMASAGTEMRNTSILFSDLNICLLRIAVNEKPERQHSVAIEGGNFDVSLCKNYSSSCIELRTDNDEKMWGVAINTAVKGRDGNKYGCGIDINPVECAREAYNYAYASNIRINADVCNFGIGIRATNYIDLSTGHYFNWCTDLTIDGSIAGCPLAIDTNVEDADIRASIQAGYFFDNISNQKPLIRYTGAFRASVASKIYDLSTAGLATMENDPSSCVTKYSNQYALEITRPEATVTAYGAFRSFYLSSNRMGKMCVIGDII